MTGSKNDWRNRLSSIALSSTLKVKCGLKRQVKDSRDKVELERVLRVNANATSNECIAMTQNILYSMAEISTGESQDEQTDSD